MTKKNQGAGTAQSQKKRRVGILGGSFNPAHEGHIALARRALHALRLDQVWLMVSPGNPFKSSQGMASFEARLASAQKLADGRKIIATPIEKRLGSRKSFVTLCRLQKQFPKINFIWLMGADNLSSLTRWYRGKDLVKQIPIAVCTRPGENQKALKSSSASWMARWRRREYEAPRLGEKGAPEWIFLHGRQMDISSTRLRAAQAAALGKNEIFLEQTLKKGIECLKPRRK